MTASVSPSSGPRYLHATDDAPLYRAPKAAGGQVWPAYRAWDDKIVLDMGGTLVTFHADDVHLIARPENLPGWAVDLVVMVRKYEDSHGPDRGGDWTCFSEALERIPPEVLAYIKELNDDAVAR